jgi:hypothetical protein
MDLSSKWPFPNFKEYHNIQEQHKIHYRSGWHNGTTILVWKCGWCQKTNEDLSRRYCIICGTPEPDRYYIVGPAIDPGIGRRWFGKLAEPIDCEDNKECDTNDSSSAYLCNTNSEHVGGNGINNIDIDTDKCGDCCNFDETACGAGELLVTCINCKMWAHEN